jgi:hypothetical protein
MNQRQRKGCGKEKAVSSAKCKLIWRSALAVNGLKLKIWKEKEIPHKAIRKQKKKVNLRSLFLKQMPYLIAY